MKPPALEYYIDDEGVVHATNGYNQQNSTMLCENGIINQTIAFNQFSRTDAPLTCLRCLCRT